jgi:hypothetical protein
VGTAILVLNKLDEGGPDHAEAIRQIENHLPPGAVLHPRAILHAPCIKRAEWTGRPAWEDADQDDAAVRSLVAFCDTYVCEAMRWRDWATMENIASTVHGARHG